MSDMKLIFENLRKALREEEQLPQAKAKAMAEAENQVTAVIGWANSVSAGDTNFAREIVESIVKGLQEQIGKL